MRQCRAEARDSQEEDRNAPDGRKVEEAGNIPGGVEENTEDVQEKSGNVPDGRKEGKKHHPIKPPVRRKRGRLSKKEEKEMKGKYKDIA
jgi:hypothetical protein